MIWVSSSGEPKALMSIANKVSTFPERFGCDILVENAATVGIQRKEINDFLSSIADGRLGDQRLKMLHNGQLDYRIILLEGKLVYTSDGILVNQSYSNRVITKDMIEQILLTLASEGFIIVKTNNLSDTIDYVEIVDKWSRKTEHSTLSSKRQLEIEDDWGRASNADWQAHILSMLPGVGIKTARNIVKHFNGSPVRWKVSKKRLMEVPGVGRKTVENIYPAFDPPRVRKKIEHL